METKNQKIKRLIDTSKRVNFRNWIRQHNPKLKWNFDNPVELTKQFVQTVSESGDIDLKTVFNEMYMNGDSNLNFIQNDKFLEEDY